MSLARRHRVESTFKLWARACNLSPRLFVYVRFSQQRLGAIGATLAL
jgi:hypothetical protein